MSETASMSLQSNQIFQRYTQIFRIATIECDYILGDSRGNRTAVFLLAAKFYDTGYINTTLLNAGTYLFLYISTAWLEISNKHIK